MNITFNPKLFTRNLLWCLSISWAIGFISISFKWQLPQILVEVMSWAVPSIPLIGRSLPDPKVWSCMATLQWLMFPVYLSLWFSVFPLKKLSPDFLAKLKRRMLPQGKKRYLGMFVGIIVGGLTILTDIKLLDFGWPTFANGEFVGSPNDLTAVLGVVYRSTTMRVLITGASPLFESFFWAIFLIYIFHFRTFMRLEKN